MPIVASVGQLEDGVDDRPQEGLTRSRCTANADGGEVQMRREIFVGLVVDQWRRGVVWKEEY